MPSTNTAVPAVSRRRRADAAPGSQRRGLAAPRARQERRPSMIDPVQTAAEPEAGATAGGQPFPASRKVYVSGTRPDVRVPMREIELTPTRVYAGPAAGAAPA